MNFRNSLQSGSFTSILWKGCVREETCQRQMTASSVQACERAAPSPVKAEHGLATGFLSEGGGSQGGHVPVKKSSTGFAPSVSPECGKEKGVEAAVRKKKKKNSHNCRQRVAYHPSGGTVVVARSTKVALVPRHLQLGLRKDLPGQEPWLGQLPTVSVFWGPW